MKKKAPKKMTLCNETIRELDGPRITAASIGDTRHPYQCTATNVCSGCRPCF